MFAASKPHICIRLCEFRIEREAAWGLRAFPGSLPIAEIANKIKAELGRDGLLFWSRAYSSDEDQ